MTSSPVCETTDTAYWFSGVWEGALVGILRATGERS